MAKKKTTPTKSKVAKKSQAKTGKPATKSAVTKTSLKNASPRKTTAKKANVKKAGKRPVKAASTPSLGRPLVTAEEKLYLLFKEDYEARQVFEFLRVDSVGDLERFSPEEIVKILSAPVRTTVQRIRRRLAEKKRALQGDEAFAHEHQVKVAEVD